MSAPKRIQLRRTKGYRKPEGAIVVARPSRWGNPFAYRSRDSGLVHYGPQHLERFGRAWDHEGRISADGTQHDMWFASDDIIETHVRWATRAELVELYRLTITAPTFGMRMAYPSRSGHFLTASVDDIRRELAGHDLACWCPLDQPCHADVLLALANEAPAQADQDPCGGCGATDESQRCIGCLHDFGPLSQWRPGVQS